MPYVLTLYPPTLQVIAVPGSEVPLQASSPTFQLDSSADAAEIERELIAAVPNQFVSVPIVYVNQLATVQVHIQPHLWAAWAISYFDDPND